MAFFEDSDELYAVAEDLLTRVQEEMPSASDGIARSHLVIRLATTDPVSEFTLNGRKRPVQIIYGPQRMRPTLNLELKADTLHEVLLGNLGLSKAVTGGKVKTQGPVLKLAALGDLFRAGQKLYPQVLRDHGLVPLS